MFNMTYKECLETYSKDISTVVPDKYCIIMEDSTFTAYPVADIILVYTPQGELVVQTVRVNRSCYSIFKWLLLLVFKKAKCPDSSLGTRFHSTKNYFDLIQYKRWYLEWAKEL